MAAGTEDTAPLVVALSSRTLFDLDESNRVFEEEGVEAYRQYQIAREDEPLEPGVAFPLVQKLSRLNAQLPGRIEVILLSRNAADTGLRVFNSIQHHGLAIERAAFCGGESPYRYMEAFGCDLFLSTVAEDVRHALAAGVAAATLLPSKAQSGGDDLLRLAFDGDAVLFSDEAEQVFKREGLEAFRSSERDAAKRPLQGGPLRPSLPRCIAFSRNSPPTPAPFVRPL